MASSVVTIEPRAGSWGVTPQRINDAGQVAVQAGGSDAYLWSEAGGWQNLGYVGYWTNPIDLNNQGQVLGINLRSDQSRNDGLLWQAGTGWQVLSGLATGVFPKAINDQGEVIGGSWLGTFYWTPVGGPQFLPSGWSFEAFNNAGQVVGRNHNTQEAFLWEVATGTSTLIGTGNVNPTAINNHGQVAGTIYEDGKTKAFIWKKGEPMITFASFGGALMWGYMNMDSAVPAAINDAGQVVGHSTKSDGTWAAFIWDATNGMRELLDPVAYPNARANDINNQGQVIGTFQSATGQFGYLATVAPPASPEVAALLAQIADLTAQLTAAQDSAASLQAQLTACGENSASLAAQLADATAQAVAVQTQLNAAQTQLANVTAERDTLQGQATAQAALIATLSAQLAEKEAQLAEKEAQLAALTTANAALASELGVSQAENTALTATNATLTVRLAAADATIAALNAELAAARSTMANLSTSLASSLNLPGIQIAGDTPAEQIATLTGAIAKLNPGQKKALYDNLSPTKKGK